MEVTLKDICEMQSGGTPKRGNALFYGGEIPWVTISDFKNAVGDIIETTEETLTTDGLKEINNRYFSKGTLLLAMYGSIGKTAILGVDASTNQAILGIRPKDERYLNIKYIKYWLDYNKDYIYFQGQGAALRNISLSIVQRQKLDLPDIETQNKIVVLLDKAKIILEKREETIKRYNELIRATFLDMFGDPVINSKGWDTITLAELGTWQSGGTPSRSNPQYFMGDIPWATSGELNDLYISKTNEYITREALDNSNAKLIPAKSILIGMYDTAALKSSLNTIPLACNQAIAYSNIPAHKCNLLYLHTVLQIGKDFYKSTQRGGRQQNLNLTMIRNISIPNPPKDLQEKFEDRIKNIQNLIFRAETFKSKTNDLLKSLSQQVFNEKLVIDINAQLDALIDAIDLEKKYEENNIDTILEDIYLVQRLIDRLEVQDFDNKDQYDKAKYILFRIMKKEENLVKQIYIENKIRLTLLNETP